MITLTLILSIIFTSLIHITIVIYAEGILFLKVLSKIEITALDHAIKSSLSNIINFNTINEYINKLNPTDKLTINKIKNKFLEREESYINYQNQLATNNFYILIVGLVIALIIILYYLHFVKHENVDWVHIVSTVLCIFTLIAIYELALIFSTILKMSYNEDSILLKILNKF
jgi:hypothetical protein